ncbi:MAG: Acetylglutamate/acetylaminoadipate kinase [Methanomassiliicoccales archaeon PtaB.Bin134]|nr:MAG: Acetylglutamate/acetylaminoadipate kinase [Methanomassiliicoccales archaeon PtaB.Bin134]
MTSSTSVVSKAKVVVKFGGSSIGGMDQIDVFAAEIAELVRRGVTPVILHGGGPEITEEMKRCGLPVKKVAGLRITDDTTLLIAKSVLSRINDRVVVSLRKAGLKAIGLAGSEGNTLLARKMPPVPVDGGPETVDLGFVGEVEGVDPTMIDTLCSLGFVPVVYSICGDAEGRLMNVNADTAAAALAAGIKATDMVLVTEVPGVLRVFEDMSSTIPEIREADLGPLTSSGILKDGMIPKVEACFLALRGGVGTAHIICGTTPDVIVEQLFSGRNLGTRLTL